MYMPTAVSSIEQLQERCTILNTFEFRKMQNHFQKSFKDYLKRTNASPFFYTVRWGAFEVEGYKVRGTAYVDRWGN